MGSKGELTQEWVSLWRHHAPSVAHASEFLQRQNVPTAWSPHQMIPKDKCHPHQRAHTWYTLSNCSSSIRRKFTMGNAIYASEKKRKSKWVPKINLPKMQLWWSGGSYYCGNFCVDCKRKMYYIHVWCRITLLCISFGDFLICEIIRFVISSAET